MVSSSLLEVGKGQGSLLNTLKINKDVPVEPDRPRKKPKIGRSELNSSSDLSSRLSSFLPQLKAANDALPEDRRDVDIEAVTENEPYIEMDLGLGVLEHKDGSADAEAHRSEAEAAEEDSGGGGAIDKLMNRPPTRGTALIQQLPEAIPRPQVDNGGAIEAKLRHYLEDCPPDKQTKMHLILSLMTRIIRQLRIPQTKVRTITKLNVLRDDLYRLMRRRDSLLAVSSPVSDASRVSSKDDLKTGDDWHEVQPRTPNGGRERDSPLRGLPPERRSPRAKKPPPKRFIDELEVEMAYSRKRRKLTHPPPLRADTEKVTLSKQVYEIEQVVGHDGDRLRVRWSGHGADGDTWEGPGNIDLFRAPVVQSYLKSHGLSMPKKKTSRTRASTVA